MKGKYLITCIVCGKTFLGGTKAVCCSPECHKALHEKYHASRPSNSDRSKRLASLLNGNGIEITEWRGQRRMGGKAMWRVVH